MALENVMQVWPVLALIAFLVMIGFMRAVTRQVEHQIRTHNTARLAVEMRQDYLRKRQEQLARQKELMSKL